MSEQRKRFIALKKGKIAIGDLNPEDIENMGEAYEGDVKEQEEKEAKEAEKVAANRKRMGKGGGKGESKEGKNSEVNAWGEREKGGELQPVSDSDED